MDAQSFGSASMPASYAWARRESRAYSSVLTPRPSSWTTRPLPTESRSVRRRSSVGPGGSKDADLQGAAYAMFGNDALSNVTITNPNVFYSKRVLTEIYNGAYDWSLSREIADPWTWSERYRCSTWDDYLRLRGRRTLEETAIQQRANQMHIGIEPIRIRRWLDRPSGSVRWREEVPDRGDTQLVVPKP